MQPSRINCQWDQCGKTASTHVRLGMPIEMMKDGPCRVALAERPNHVDLCSAHVEETRVFYLHIELNDVGMCPIRDCV